MHNNAHAPANLTARDAFTQLGTKTPFRRIAQKDAAIIVKFFPSKIDISYLQIGADVVS